MNHVYLLERSTVKEADGLIDVVDDTVFQISKNPELFKISIFDSESREAVITKEQACFID